MPRVFTCPFWAWEAGRKLHCEGAVVGFKSASARNAYLERYCTDVPGWESCPIAAALLRSYEREAEQARQRKTPAP